MCIRDRPIPTMEKRKNHRNSCCKAVWDAAFHLPLSCGDLRKSQVVVSGCFYRIVYLSVKCLLFSYKKMIPQNTGFFHTKSVNKSPFATSQTPENAPAKRYTILYVVAFLSAHGYMRCKEMAEQQVKSRQRVADHGEVFTAAVSYTHLTLPTKA